MKNTTSKPAKAFIWILINLIYGFALYYGLQGNEGAWRVFEFILWLSFISSTIVMLSTDARKQLHATGRSVPNWVTIPYDFGVILTLVYFGQMGLAVVALLQTCFEASVFDVAPSK